MQEVIAYLERVDPDAAARARERYACFDHFSGDDGQSYGFEAAFGAGESCERQVIDQLVDLQRHALDYARRDGLLADDDAFYAEQNAITVRDAEEYYRSMFGGRVSSWNLRDRHMTDTLEALSRHLTRQRGEPAKIAVWAHNSHVGDARATELGAAGEFNVGQLVRERHADDCSIIGFTTYTGTVTVADNWGGAAERMQVRPALPESFEELFHEVGEKAFLLRPSGSQLTRNALRSARLERAIGVVYRPRTERQSHYFRAAWPTSSTESSTSMKRGPSSRWSGQLSGMRAKCRRPTRSTCKPHLEVLCQYLDGSGRSPTRFCASSSSWSCSSSLEEAPDSTGDRQRSTITTRNLIERSIGIKC
jgi:erythromycin esterase-like protein